VLTSGAPVAAAPVATLAWQMHFETGLEFIAQQEYAPAVSELSQAIVEAPEEEVGKCYSTRGYAQLCLGNAAAAIDDCTLGISHDPFDGEAYAWRGSAYAVERQWRSAIEDYLMAIRLVPESAAEYRQIATAHAQHAIAEFTSLERQKKANTQTIFDRGIAYAFLGQYEAAIRDFGQSIKADQRDAVAYSKRAECHAALKHHDRVVVDCKAAISFGARSPQIYFLRGVAQRELGHLDQAVADLTKALELDTDYVAAYYERGRVRQQRGDWHQALADYTAAIGLAPDVHEYYGARAAVHAALDDHSSAADDFALALQLLPGDTAMLLARGNELVACDRLEEALQDFDTALSYDAACAPAFRGRGMVYARGQQFDQAMLEFSKAIRLNAKYGEAFAARGDVFLEQQRYEQAIADFSKAIDLGCPTAELARLHYRRGMAYLDAGKAEKAAEDLDRSLKLKPNNPDALAWRGSARGHLQNWRAALDDLTLATELNPGGRELYDQLGTACAQAAVEALERRVEDKNDAEALLDYAAALDFLGSDQDALLNYNAAIKLAPTNIDGYLRRGKLLARNHKHEHAANDFSRALKIDPQQATALHGRALARRALNKVEEALADISAAIELEPQSARMRRDRAVIYALLGKHDEALQDFQRAIDGAHATAEVYYERGMSRMALGKIEAAIADFDVAIGLAPAHVRALNQRGEAYVLRKQFKKALADFDAAIAIDPNFVAAHCSRGLALARLGQPDQAILDLTKAAAKLKYDPAFAAALAARARIQYSLGRYQRAALDYSLVLQLRPPGHNYPHTLYGRGLAMLQLGDVASAERNFAKAAELNPQFKPAQTALTWIKGDRAGQRPAELRAPESKKAVPKPPVAGPAVIVDASKSTQWQIEPLWDQWIVRTAHGQEFGPVQKAELDRWCAEGRLHPTYWLIRLDWDQWRAAGEVYFELAFETLRSSNRPVPVSIVPEEEYVEEVEEVEDVQEFTEEQPLATPEVSSDFAEFAKQFSKPAPGATEDFPGININIK
jgi:tetratricopeptide (TPR) repeat protein